MLSGCVLKLAIMPILYLLGSAAKRIASWSTIRQEWLSPLALEKVLQSGIYTLRPLSHTVGRIYYQSFTKKVRIGGFLCPL